MRAFAVAEWSRAWRTLRSGDLLVSTDPDSAASRAYYAAFHGLTAFFALHGRSFTKHSAIRSALHKDLVNTAALDADAGQAYDFLMDLRELGDYGGVSGVSVDNALLALRQAELFLGKLRALSAELQATDIDPRQPAK